MSEIIISKSLRLYDSDKRSYGDKPLIEASGVLWGRKRNAFARGPGRRPTFMPGTGVWPKGFGI